MKTTLYIRVAKTKKGNKVAATSKPSVEPLSGTESTRGYAKVFLPTVAFAISVEIPDSLFNKASQVVATLNITEKQSVIAAQIEVPAAK